MQSQLCECDSRGCLAEFRATIDQLIELRRNPKVVLLSKKCVIGPKPTDKLVDEGEEFLAYEEEA